MSIKRQSFVLLSVALVTSSAASGESQKWCQWAELIPKNDRGKWFTANDLSSDGPFMRYPKYDSVGSYQLFVNADGRVKKCTTVKAAGIEALDRMGCGNLLRRARFNVLVDPPCSDVIRAATYSIRYSWSDTYKGPEETAPHWLTGVL